MKRLTYLFIFCLLSIATWASEESFRGLVVEILDGNTMNIKSEVDDEVVLVMLEGVDSPELGQKYGEEAKKLLEKRMLNKAVCVTITGMDRWGKKYGIVTTKKVDPRIDLLKSGLAWTAEKNPIEELESYKQEAYNKGLGLWEEKDPTPPWTYRRQQTMMRAKSSS